jgi:hypothetical protein
MIFAGVVVMFSPSILLDVMPELREGKRKDVGRMSSLPLMLFSPAETLTFPGIPDLSEGGAIC